MMMQGAREDGFTGGCVGLAKGMGAAVACTVVGTGVAAVQIGRGVYNTPEVNHV